MSEIERLDELAGYINEEHRRCEEALRSGLSHALRAGELLTEAKSRVHHGEWGSWIEANFEGSGRTAQAYMKVWRDLPQLEGANPQRVADLSFRGALKELTASPETLGVAEKGDLTKEERVDLIRKLLDTFGPELSEEERVAVERRLEKPGAAEDSLVTEVNLENFYLLAAVVAQDGFFFVVGDDGEPLMEYRSECKSKITRAALPTTDEALRDRVSRGCRVYSIFFFKTWRHLSNWLTKVVITECNDLDTVEKRVAQNADWRQAEPAADYLRKALLDDVDPVHWAQEHGLSHRDLREMLAGVESWVSVDARRMEKNMMSATRG